MSSVAGFPQTPLVIFWDKVMMTLFHPSYLPYLDEKLAWIVAGLQRGDEVFILVGFGGLVALALIAFYVPSLLCASKSPKKIKTVKEEDKSKNVEISDVSKTKAASPSSAAVPPSTKSAFETPKRPDEASASGNGGNAEGVVAATPSVASPRSPAIHSGVLKKRRGGFLVFTSTSTLTYQLIRPEDAPETLVLYYGRNLPTISTPTGQEAASLPAGSTELYRRASCIVLNKLSSAKKDTRNSLCFTVSQSPGTELKLKAGTTAERNTWVEKILGAIAELPS